MEVTRGQTNERLMRYELFLFWTVSKLVQDY